MTNDVAPLERQLPAAPVRILHLGLGNFFRAHQAWYTHHAPDAAEWGIAAFSNRSRELADAVAAQGGVYTLVVRAADGDHIEVINSLSEAHPGGDHEKLQSVWSLPDLAVVTLTVTEAGYCRAANGHLDLNDPNVSKDIAALKGAVDAEVSSAPARLVAGILARAQAGLSPVTIVSCDNLPDNGSVVRTVVTDLAEQISPEAVAAVEATGFATSMVDRITPATSDEDLVSVAEETGVADQAPVITEPFSEWVISGDFVAGHPDWASAGAQIVDDVRPFEQRKLWLLNGAHSFLAYAGLSAGHETVAEAVQDDTLVAGMNAWWDEATTHLELPASHLDSYRSSLTDRFANPRIRHLLSQIASDGSQKLPIRVVPVLKRERAAGRSGEGAARVMAAWLRYLRSEHPSIKDPRKDEIVAAAAGDDVGAAAQRIVSLLDPELGEDAETVSLVTRLVS